MSGGQLEIFGLVENWDDIKSFLFSTDPDPGLAQGSGSKDSDKKSEQQEDSWDNDDWGWNEDQDESSNNKDKENKNKDKEPKKEALDLKTKVNSWPQNSIVAHSPMGNVFVVAQNTKAIFFTSEWDLRKSRVKFLKSYQGELSQEDGERITSVICIPLVSKKLTSPGAPDWTCIVVGFSTGHVRMYTENGNNLLSQMFHNQSIISFKCRSYQPANNATDHDQLEELFILYETVIVTMDGFSLFQTLRACRNHAARLQANATEAMMDPPPLSYKKWQYENQKRANDCDSVGLNTPVTFDHLVTASILGGIHAKCKPVPLTSYIFVSTGRKPYVTFNYAQEGQAIPVLTEIAYAMASKLKSSLISAASGWLGFGGSAKPVPPKEKPKPQIEPATSMSNRFGFVDNGRVGHSVSVSPCRKLTAVTDTLGRVILIDNNLGLAVRMWKGYREAQVGWLQVTEEVSKSSSSSHGHGHGRSSRHSSRHRQVYGREALFIVIYAPRRGHLEVYAMQQGPKVATFNVVRNGRLISTTWGMMGLNNIPLKGGNKPVVQCLFIDPEAQLFTLNIPFHLALCDKTRSKAQDVHLLKSLQKLLKEKKQEEITAREIFEILKEVQIQSMINQGFKILTQKLTQTGVFIEILENYLAAFCEDEEKDLSIVFRLQSILELYTFLLDTTQKPPEYIEPVESPTEESQDQTILRLLHSSTKEIKTLQDMGVKFSRSSAASTSCKKDSPKAKSVKFEDEHDPDYDSRDKSLPTLPAFFSTLAIEFDTNKIKESHDSRVSLPVANVKPGPSTSAGSSSGSGPGSVSGSSHERHIKFNPKSEYTSSLGLLLFSGVLNHPSDLEEWKNRIKSSGLIPLEILLLALKFWCETALLSSSYVICMKQLYHVLTALCQLEPQSVNTEFNKASKWWEAVRKEMTKSPRIFHTYSFAIVCRGVAIELLNEHEMKLRQSGEKKRKLEENDEELLAASSDLDMADWENISLDLLRWTLLLKQIEDLFLLSTVLVQKPLLDSTDQVMPLLSNEIQELSVSDLLDKGKGCIAELVGKWLSTIGIDPNRIVCKEDHVQIGGPYGFVPPPSPEPRHKNRKRLKLIQGDDAGNGEKVTDEEQMEEERETGAEALDIVDDDPFSDIADVKDLLKCLKENFSISLSTSIIIANYCWEYCLEWNKDTNEMEYLAAAIKCVQAIPGPQMKQGMMSMMWSTFLGKKFAGSVAAGSGSSAAAAAAASNAFARQHKDQLTDKPSGFLSHEKEEAFLENMVTFFDQFMDANLLCEKMEIERQGQLQGQKGPSVGMGQREIASYSQSQNQSRGKAFKLSNNFSRAKNHWSTDASSASLTDLAVSQTHSNYEMLVLHYQLALTTHLLHKYRIKKSTMKPVTMFDTKSRMLLFQDLSSQAPFSNVEVDLALKMLREDFLCRVVRRAIHEIPEEFSVNDNCRSERESSQDEKGLGFSKMIVPSPEGVRQCELLVDKVIELGRSWGNDLDVIRITNVCELYSSGLDRIGASKINTVSARDILGSKLLVIMGMRINFIMDTTSSANIVSIVAEQSTNLSSWIQNLNYSRLRCLRFSKESITEAMPQIINLIPENSYDYKLAEELYNSSDFL